jgi:hypothetical protein
VHLVHRGRHASPAFSVATNSRRFRGETKRGDVRRVARRVLAEEALMPAEQKC